MSERIIPKLKFSIAAAEKVSAKEPVLLTGEFTQSIARAKNMGYSAMEIHVQNPSMVNIDRLKEKCRSENMSISGIATGLAYANEGLCLIHADAEIRRKTVERLKSFVDFAHELNSVLLIGRMKGDINDMSRYDELEKVLAENLGEAAEYAESRNVRFMLEAINRYESNYMNKAGEIADFIRRYEIPATRVLMDVFHMNIEEASICDSIRKNFDMLGYFHVADSNRMYPGAGHAALEEIFNTLIELGYDGYVSLECLRHPDSDTAANKGIDFMHRFVKAG